MSPQPDLRLLLAPRLTNSIAPALQQVLPFEELLPSTRSDIPLPPSSFQRKRSQQRWLLKEHPEAFLGNLDLYSLVSEETRLVDSQNERSRVGATLAVGEIDDLRNSRFSHSAGSPAIAVASGEAGHVLRVYALKAEQWNWRNSVLPVGALQSSLRGSWCKDGTAISKVHFATKLKQYDNIRWLIAQKDTSTTIFEPEIRAKAVRGADQKTGQQSGTSEHIAMNAVVSLTASATAGNSHCDFSVNMGQDEDVPQLAIIDSLGNWSVWLITRDGHGRSRTTKAVLRKKGLWNLPLHIPLGGESGFLTPVPRIFWTSSANRNMRDLHSDPPTQLGQPSQGLNSVYLTGVHAAHTRYDKLAMCNSTQLQVLDPAERTNPSWLDYFRRDGADRPLDAQLFSGSPSHALVLTTDRLYLLDVTVPDFKATSTPKILISCPHFRHDHQDLLKMTVSPMRSSPGRTSALVLLYSTQSLRVSLFWFNLSHQDASAQLHHQVIQLSSLQTGNVDNTRGIECLAAVPLQLAELKGKERLQTDKHYGQGESDEIQFYQLFGLSADLRLSSSMVAIAPGSLDDPPQQVKMLNHEYKEATRSKTLRNAELQQAEQAFVLHDETKNNLPPASAHKATQIEERGVLQLRFYLLKLMQEINNAYFDQEASSEIVDNPLISIQQAGEGRGETNHVSLRSLLSYSDLWVPLDLQKLEDDWELGIRQLERIKGANLLDCGSYGPKRGVLDVVEKISIRWSARLPPESLRATQWKYMELALERMAAEVYLSERSIYMVPQPTLDLALKAGSRTQESLTGDEESQNQPPSSQPQSDMSLPIPSVTPSSSQPTPIPSPKGDEEDHEAGHEDHAVARLRMYLPSIKFTPPLRDGPSRLLSLWPEHRGIDPSRYQYAPLGKGLSEEAKRRKKKDEERRQRRADKKAQLGIKLEGPGDSFSQPIHGVVPSNVGVIQSSPPPVRHDTGGSSQTFGFGFGSSQAGSGSQSYSFNHGFGFSQVNSQPVSGEFGTRSSRLKKKVKAKPKPVSGFK